MDPSDLLARADRLPRPLRSRFRRRVQGAARVKDAERRRHSLAAVAADLEAAEAARAARAAALPETIAYPGDLPITARRDDLLAAIAGNQVVVVAGETGSGKSTQLPKLCLELGRGVDGLIGHTQPRRIAARSIAERVAEELGTAVGGLVGYTVRFTDRVGDRTLLKVMTDGILLAEIHHDPMLSRYDTIILDEAHERSLNIDFLLGYLQRLLPRRPDLKVIVTSATIDTAKFAAFFGGAPVVEVSGRSYPVEVRYRPLDGPDRTDPRDQPQAICDAVAELAGEGTGDVLVFCSGEREIRDAIEAIGRMRLPHTETIPLFARLSSSEQHRVFSAHTGRRIVVATNVAETSLTVPGIRSVVDTGTARISRYSRRTKVQRLPIEPISRASADQRAGRCGRLGPGVCIRLYDRDDYEGRPEFTDPEILRTNLASVILQMAAMDLGDVESFPFLDPPDRRAVRDGIALLHELGAVDPAHEGTREWLTPLGGRLARLPLDPRLGRMVLAAADANCLREVLVIAAALTIPDPRERPEGKEAQAAQSHARFRDDESDFLSWLHLWEYVRGERRERTSSSFRRMCANEYLNYRRVREWQDLHGQLRDLAKEMGLSVNRKPADPEVIHRSLLTGLLGQVGRKDPDSYEYRGARGARFSIAPGSTLFKRAPEWVMAAEVVETGRMWARGIARVPPAWIEEVGAHLIDRSYGDPWWDEQQEAALAAETATLYGIPLAVDRTVQYARIDPEAARDLFVRHALVGGEWSARHDFVAHNAAQIAEVLEMEARERRADLLVDDDTLAAWFDARIPPEVVTARRFDRWWRDARSSDPQRFHLSVDDLIDRRAPAPDPDAFPEVWRHGDLAFTLDYEFDPASPTDGMTVDVPLADLQRTDPSLFEWNVPGRRAEVIEAMVRSLPKSLRRRFVPIAETVAAVAAGLRPGEESLVQGLRRELGRLGGVTVPADAFDPAALPPHLRVRYRVVGDDGEAVAEGDDLAALKAHLADEARRTIATGRHPLERDGLTGWDLDDLPAVVEVGEGAHRARAYPALVDEGGTVAVRLLPTPAEQAAAMRPGACRLLLASLHSPELILRPLVDRDARRLVRVGPYADAAGWIDDCLLSAAAALMDEAGGPPRSRDSFEAVRAVLRDGLAEQATAVAGHSLALLASVERVEAMLGPLEERFPAAVGDVVAQVNRLVYPGFLLGVGAARVPDVARYLQAVERRLEVLPSRPGRDAEAMAVVHRLEAEHDRLAALLPPGPESAEVAWMLEELRVSLFAQGVGTRGKVSPQRIERALAALEA
ncbi:MAG: ATP-dependent RNA helicase HrpA [Actinobacteria bacterium]|nr:ATP-dependent RNA helicase HrpA [Actinomycetota bacterium]